MPIDANVFTRMVGKVAAAARENCVGPRSINMDYASELGSRGQVINVPITARIPGRTVTPGAVPPGSAQPDARFAPISLDFHREAPFTFTEVQLSGLDDPNSWISRQLEESGRTIANEVDVSIFNLYRFVPHRVGTAGTTPFATSTAALQEAERQLLSNVAPVGNRRLLMDPFAFANAMGLNVFQNSLSFGDSLIKEGKIPRALGYDWGVSQNAPRHTRGLLGGTPLINGAMAAGTTSLITDGWSNSTQVLNQGDIITIAGDSNPYVVTANVTSSGAGVATIPISNGFSQATPGLLIATADNAAISTVASHQINLAVHPDFGAFACRRLDSVKIEGRTTFQTSWSDPNSGLVLDIRIVEQHYQVEFSVSCLWGVGIVKPEYAVRVMG
jgi:hypothetical protein